MKMSDRCIKRHFKTQEPRDVDEEANLWILDHDDGARIDAGRTDYSADGYFGNEASEVHFYVKACLIIDVSPYTESRGMTDDQQLPQKKKQKTKESSDLAAVC